MYGHLLCQALCLGLHVQEDQTKSSGASGLTGYLWSCSLDWGIWGRCGEDE